MGLSNIDVLHRSLQSVEQLKQIVPSSPSASPPPAVPLHFAVDIPPVEHIVAESESDNSGDDVAESHVRPVLLTGAND